MLGCEVNPFGEVVVLQLQAGERRGIQRGGNRREESNLECESSEEVSD